MVFSSDLSRDELHAELVGALVEVVQQALAIPFFVVVLALVGVFLALGEQRVDQSNARACERLRPRPWGQALN